MSYTQSLLTAAESIAIQSADMPDAIDDGWVRLELATASICGTDMHYFRHFANAGFFLDYPVTLGHEACAIVVDANGSSFDNGQLVAINPIIECGQCEKCQSGDINMCPNKRFPGSATTKPHINGFFRDYFDFPAKCCHAVNANVDPDHLTFTEPLACAMHAVNQGQIREGMNVLVTGCGPMGLLATIAARAKGSQVHVTDVKQDSVDAALAVGAEDGFLAGDDSRRPPSNSYDVVIEASGSAHAYNQALDAVCKQGTISVLSLIQPSAVPVNLHLNALKEIQSVGSILYTNEFADALRLIESQTVDFGRIIAARFAVRDTQRACELMASGNAVGKVLIKRVCKDINP